MCTSNPLNYAIWEIDAIKDVGINSVFLKSIKRGLDTCCQSDISLVLVRSAANPRDLGEFHNEVSEDILFPIVRSVNHGQFIQHSTPYASFFIPFFESPGIAVLETAKTSSPLLDTMVGSVSLLILMILLCVASGILVWSLDTYFNPSDFPRSFIKGGPEGVWWAFVTMTTVGYGDRTPKSAGARFLGVIWTIIGIVLVAVFTATVTTALTSDSVRTADLFGSKVGAHNWSEEHLYAGMMGAKVTGYKGLVAMLDGLVNGEVEMALIDMMHLIPMSRALLLRKIKMSLTITSPRIHGLSINGFNQQEIACLTREMMHSRYPASVTFDGLNVISKNQSYSTAENVGRVIGISQAVLLSMAGALVCIVAGICLLQMLIFPKIRSRGKNSSSALVIETNASKRTPAKDVELKSVNMHESHK